MHIPDAVLAPSVLLSTGLMALGGLAYGAWTLRGTLGDRTTVLMGSTAAFVFAAQMVNFPLGPFPVSGHLLGGVLSAVLVGPWAGAMVIGAVLIVQCFVFGDGGLTALGANFVNMGLIGSVVGFAIYDPIRRGVGGARGVLLGSMLAAWFSVILASAGFAVELAASGHWGSFPTVLGWMALVHSAIGVGEALITGSVVRFLLLVRPDLIDGALARPERVGPVEFARGPRRWAPTALGALAASVAVAVFVAPWASEHPDGLEFVGAEKGKFLPAEGAGTEREAGAPMGGYRMPGLDRFRPGVATAAAGALGTVVVFGVGLVLARSVSRVAGLDPKPGGAVDADPGD